MSPKNKNKEKDPSDPDAFVFSTDVVIGDIQRKAMQVFEVFDQQGQKSVDVREVGTMCRALELFLSEADVHEIIGAVEEPTAKGTVKVNTFINYMTKVITEGKFKPVSKEELEEAFRGFDRDKKGVLEPPKFKDILMREGEAFTLEEVEEMFNYAVHKETLLIHWQEYVEKLYRNLRL